MAAGESSGGSVPRLVGRGRVDEIEQLTEAFGGGLELGAVPVEAIAGDARPAVGPDHAEQHVLEQLDPGEGVPAAEA